MNELSSFINCKKIIVFESVYKTIFKYLYLYPTTFFIESVDIYIIINGYLYFNYFPKYIIREIVTIVNKNKMYLVQDE